MTINTQTGPANGDITAHRWLILGAEGQLGTELTLLLRSRDAAQQAGGLTPAGRAQLDLSSTDQIQAFIDTWLAEQDDRTPVVINAAAYTAVDAAESDESAAALINAAAPRAIATALAGRARLIHVSTDYVFAGVADQPYRPNDQTGPRTAYGRTKLAGDLAVRELASDTGYVVRTAWVYGAHGPNFVKTMAKFSRDRPTLQVVADQVGSPTWTFDLAKSLLEIATADVPAGIYHCTGGGQTSWCDFARAIFQELSLDPSRVEATTAAAYVRPAPRPAYSVLSSEEWLAAGLRPMPHWRDSLHEAFSRDGDLLRG